MKKWAYYNEHDPYAAQWIRNLIAAGHVAPGYVDERSIEDVRPDDVREFAQAHWFAGIAIWSVALRNVGFPDDARIWTGSCPCQPFSAAGKGNGFADERHLWPAFYHLILNCEPGLVAGEQVASRDGLAWLDTVQTDMEIADYAFRAADTCAAGFGAPHIRQRLYWMADANSAGLRAGGWIGGNRTGDATAQYPHGSGSFVLADTIGQGLEGRDARQMGLERSTIERNGESEFDGLAHPTHANGWSGERGTQEGIGPDEFGRFGSCGGGAVGGMADADGRNASEEWQQRGGEHRQFPQDGGPRDHGERPGPTNGHWRAADWLYCRDDKWRAVEPGTFPLAHGASSRVGRLRAYGNAINLAQAEGFLRAALY